MTCKHLFPIPAALVLAALASPLMAGSWAGKEITKNGVVHVINPAAPIDGSSSITPVQIWRAGGDEEGDALFGVLSSIDIDAQGNVYALDMQLSQVNVFDRDGRLLRAIGREGEGPGEFRRPSGMFLSPDGNVAVLQMMPGKLIMLTPDGLPAADYPGPKGGDGGMISYFEGGAAGPAFVLGTREFARHDNSFTITRSLLALDGTGQTRATLFTETNSRDLAAMMNVDEKETRNLVWAGGRDGRIYTSENFDAYEIKVFSPEGKLARVIEREYTPRQRNKQEMEDNKPRIVMRGAGGQRMDPQIKSSPTDRDLLRMIPRDDGTLWVLTSRGGNDQPAGTLATFDVFDANGRFVRSLAVKAPIDSKQDEFHIVRDQLVVVKSVRSARDAMFAEGDDGSTAKDEAGPEPVSLVCYRLDPQPTAKR